MSKKPRIVLLHGTPVAVEPIQKSFATRWPEAEVVNLLDDSLSVDRAKDHDLTPRMFERFMELGGYAQRIGADGILVTCSAFGPAIERMTRELPMPVLKPNEAMFKAAMTRGQRIGMLATFAPSVLTMTEEFDEFVRATGRRGRSRRSWWTAPWTPCARATRKRTTSWWPHAQPSLAIATRSCSPTSRHRVRPSLVGAKVSVPVLTAPDAAVDRMRSMVA